MMFYIKDIQYLLAVVLVFVSSIHLNSGLSRIDRYEKLYQTHKCHFPPSNPSLFGPSGILADCANLGDPKMNPEGYYLTEQLCQSLMDELLLYCHADQIVTFSRGNILNTSIVSSFLNTSNLNDVCNEPVVKKYHPNSEWKMLGDRGLCEKICSAHLYICRMKVYLWKLAKVEEDAENVKPPINTTTSLSVNTTTAITTPKPTTTIPATTVSTTKAIPTTTQSLQDRLNTVIKGIDNGVDNSNPPMRGEGSIPSHKKKSLGLASKLFIFFGVCSIILIVGAYVAYYKRAQIRAFCCEDPGDVRYRRIREDRKQQAAQPLKNLAF